MIETSGGRTPNEPLEGNTMGKFTRTKILSASALALTAGLGLGSAAFAQDASDEADAVMDTIVVTGFATANRDAIAAKRASDGILDAASADQIGLLPDLDITQVAQRIPGLSVISTFGVTNDRSSDDTEAVVIRGLDPNFNLVTVDGVPIASTDEDDRRTKTSIIPPSVVGRVEAVKTLTADLDPHGLSGQLDLVTVSAFDRDEPFLSTRFSIGENSTAGELVDDQGQDLRADVVFSTKFGDQDQFGFVAAGSYHEFFSTNYEEKPGARDDTYLILDETTGFISSRRNQIFAFEDERERISGILKFEYQPSDATDLSLFYGRFEETEDEKRWEYLANGDDDEPLLNATATTGTWSEGRVEYGFVDQPEKTTVDILTAKGSHRFGDKSEIHGVLSYSQAEVDVIRNMSKLRPGSNADGAFSYDISSGRPRLSFVNDDAVNDLSRYTSSYIRARNQAISQDLTYGEVNYDWNFDSSSSGFGFNIGASATLRDQSFDREYREGDVYNTVGCTEADVTDCPPATLDQFALSTTLPGLGPDVRFALMDDAAFRAAWADQGEPITNDRTDNSIRDDYTMTEDAYALFAQSVYRGDRFTVRGGLRFDTTEIDVDLFARDRSLDDDPNDAAEYVPVSRSSEYDYLLPSLIASYDLTENVILRGGYGRTIGRPSFDDYASGESIGVPDLEEGTVSISRGNPDLEPRVSDNFDVSLEYYFDDGVSLLSAAVFYKDVQDMIFVQEQIIENFELDGALLTARVEQPVNANAAKISGIELSLRKDFANTLPPPFDGFIVNANMTFLDGEVTLVDADGGTRTLDAWEKQPEFIGNLQVAYEKGPFGAKVAYNYVDEYLNDVNEESADFDIYREGRSEIDLQARYQLTDAIKLVAEVQNLTEESVTSVRSGPFDGLLAQETEKGRRVWLGFTWTPGLGR